MIPILTVGMSGRYKFVKKKLSTSEVVQELEFPNVITNTGLDRWGVGAIGNVCKLGAGNTPPSVNDTGLASPLITTSATQSLPNFRAYSVAERWTECTRIFRFAPGVAVNSIAEVAIGWDTGIFSRALIRDPNGNPITLQLLADEVLDVYYTLRMQFPATDITGTIALNNVDYDWIMRPSEIDSIPGYDTAWFDASFGGSDAGYFTASLSTNPIASVDSSPTGAAFRDSMVITPYVAGSFTQRITYKFDLNTGNFGIKAIVVRPCGTSYNTVEWQLGFYQGGVPVGVPKTSSMRLQLTFDFAWGRA